MSPITKTDFLASVAKPDRNGYSALTELGERSPAVLIVHLVRALDVGALQLVFASDVHIPAESLARDKPLARQPDEKRFANDGSRVSPSDLGLTERQLEVLALVMQGKRNKAICRVLNLAEPTVEEPCHRNPKSAGGVHSHRGGHCSRQIGLEIADGYRIIGRVSGTTGLG